jgi:hypothetical protein
VGTLLEANERMNVEESSEDGDFSCRGRLGNLGSPSTGTFRDGWRAPEREHLFFVGALLGGALLWGSGRWAPGMDTIL